jgi:hypothetical protein
LSPYFESITGLNFNGAWRKAVEESYEQRMKENDPTSDAAWANELRWRKILLAKYPHWEA